MSDHFRDNNDEILMQVFYQLEIKLAAPVG